MYKAHRCMVVVVLFSLFIIPIAMGTLFAEGAAFPDGGFIMPAQREDSTIIIRPITPDPSMGTRIIGSVDPNLNQDKTSLLTQTSPDRTPVTLVAHSFQFYLSRKYPLFSILVHYLLRYWD